MWTKKAIWSKETTKPEILQDQIAKQIELQVQKISVKNGDVIFQLLDDEFVTESWDDYGELLKYFDSAEIKKRLLYAINYADRLFDKLPEKYTYHNKAHTLRQVVPWCMTFASFSGNKLGTHTYKSRVIPEEEKEILFIAALYHDLWFLKSARSNEHRWALYAELVMKKIGYDQEKIEKVKEIILATSHGIVPKTDLQEIIRDADMAHLGDSYTEFADKTERLFQEYHTCKITPPKLKYVERFKGEPEFFATHDYHHEVAIHMLSQRKKFNLDLIYQEIARLEKTKK